jgi:steroid 5-alpha reductase family enzyme
MSMTLAIGPFLLNLVLTAAIIAVVMALTFATALRQGRHSIVDVAWGLGHGTVALATYAMSAGEGDGARRGLVTALTVVWGLRLAAHITRARGKGEDPRYEAFLSRAPGSRTVYALRKIYLSQGMILWIVSLPVQLAMYETGPAGPLLLVGTVVWAVGFFFESVGDLQLLRFTSDPDNRGKVMDRGLWRYTRHPNYFGDALVWWGLFIAACDWLPGALTVVSPMVITWYLVKKTGKPLMERHLTRSRAGYAQYVTRTSGFIPLPPRRAG